MQPISQICCQRALGRHGGSAIACGDRSVPILNSAQQRNIVSFVGRVTKGGGADFVPEAQRVAVFDNDDTLGAEQPNYVQAFFVFDRVKAMGTARTVGA